MTKTQLEDTGERMIPEHHKGYNIYGAHLGRYQAGMSLVKDKVVLDIACGSGYGSKLMASTARKVYGVDIDADTVSYATEHYGAKNITYLQGDGISIPLEDASVEVVASYETIEHIADYQTFMKEVKRVLKPGGLLLLSTPNDAEYAEGNHFHLHEFTYSELKSLVEKYFRHHKDYFQTLWLASSIFPRELQTTEWELSTQMTNTVALRPEQSIYFFLICSDSAISGGIEPQTVLGEHFRQRDLQTRNEKYAALHNKLEESRDQVKKLEDRSDNLQKKLHTIQNSRTWKTAHLLQKGIHRLKHPLTNTRR